MKIGLLPLYIKLYDDVTPNLRIRLQDFYYEIAGKFEGRGIEVVKSPLCRIKPEFEAAVKSFEDNDVDALVTLHLAYSPSLESAEVLAKTKLPIIVLDTTPDYKFDPTVDAAIIDYNHGIHGVQDMCNLLRRNGKKFDIFVGNSDRSNVINDVIDAVRGNIIASALRNARVGMFGKPFRGMGDFAIPFDKLKKDLGMKVVPFESGLPKVSDDEIKAEYEKDCKTADMSRVSYDRYAPCEKVALGIRKWIAKNKITAFTMNFLDADKNTEYATIPFAEACKQMYNGVGYAGEGDVMTAALVGAMLKVYPETTFSEMFCANWEGNYMFVSHMGEYNFRCARGTLRYFCDDFAYAPALPPSFAISPLKPGKALFACLAPQPGDKYSLILSEVEMMDVPENANFINIVNGWFKPHIPVAEFLKAYSKRGGIHHAILTYNGSITAMTALAENMGWNVEII